MGGRTDATNLIRKPVCSVITSVSMDHMQFLGNTLTEIAQAKAGIIKKDCPIVTIMQKAEAMEAIKAEAEKAACKASVADVPRCQWKNDNVKRDKVWLSGTWNGEKPGLQELIRWRTVVWRSTVFKRRSWNCRPDHF